mmetsp:Transcript_29622/g.91588  ORF Transcript_29622/g.91588 Transcript_29622/m.91588 type:complete len:165 (+) Transcript_29622:823-1317(+)
MIDPGTHEQGEDYAAYCDRRWGGDGWTQSLRAKGARVGAPFANWKVWPNTFRAHQLLRFAPLEKEGAVKQRIMEGIYERGENVSDVATLCAVAADAGVDVDGFKEILDTPAARDDVRRECAQASARGVGGVPYFIIHGAETKRPIGFSGAVDASQLVEIICEVL